MLRKKHREKKRACSRPGNIGTLEKRANVTDRTAFWKPYASLDDGFQQGVAELRRIAEAREEKLAEDAGWHQDEDGDWDHPDREDAVYATAYDVVVANDLGDNEELQAK